MLAAGMTKQELVDEAERLLRLSHDVPGLFGAARIGARERMIQRAIRFRELASHA